MALRPYISLCSGIGGLDLAVRCALPGSRCVLYVERELTAAAVLAARMEDGSLDRAPVWSDLRTLDTGRFRGCVAGVIGGIPCQPFSTAGKRRGEHDDRDLWPDALRLVGEVGPEWCFFENVPGMANKSVDWYIYRAVLPRLEEMGYRTAAGIFSAEEVGAPHLRERLFILAHRAGARREGEGEHGGRPPLQAARPVERGPELAHAGHGAGGPEQRVEQEERPAGAGQRSGAVGDAESDGIQGRRTAGQQEPRTQVGPALSRRAEHCLRPDEWPPGPSDRAAWARVLAVRPDLAPATPRPSFRGLANGTAGGMAGLGRADKLRLLGNAVVPATAALAFRTLAAKLEVPMLAGAQT